MDSENENNKENKNEVENIILSKYYLLKNEYDTKYSDYKKNLLKNKNLSMNEKRKELLKHKRKCVGCNKPVETIFKNDKESLEVRCGSTSSPCGLNIKIKKDYNDFIPSGIKEMLKTINDIKIEIISNKLDLLFDYLNENIVLSNFKKQTDELNEFMEFYNELLTKDIDLQNNTKKKIELKNLNITKNELLEKIKENLEVFKNENNTALLKDIIEIYKNDLYPLLKKESEIKYSHNSIDINENDNTFILNQKKISFCDLFLTYGQVELLEDKTK